jgi:hypothetical protein
MRFEVHAISAEHAKAYNNSNVPNEVLLRTNSLLKATLYAIFRKIGGAWVDAGEPFVVDTWRDKL